MKPIRISTQQPSGPLHDEQRYRAPRNREPGYGVCLGMLYESDGLRQRVDTQREQEVGAEKDGKALILAISVVERQVWPAHRLLHSGEEQQRRAYVNQCQVTIRRYDQRVFNNADADGRERKDDAREQ